MGKGGRIACIFTPWAMTIVALVLQVIVQLGGKTVDSGLLNSVYGWQADFRKYQVDSGLNDVEQKVAALFTKSKANGQLQQLYQIHIYNFCTASKADGVIDSCGARSNGFVFDPIHDFHLDGSVSKRDNAISSSVTNAVNNAQAQAESTLGDGVVKALNAYKTASKWMSIAFEVALWTSVATAVAGILAIFSRIGSFITWFLSLASSIFAFAAALTSTIIFAALVGALKAILDPLHVDVQLGGTFLAYVWISAFLSIGATTFWLMSVCCCSGKSNPHHKGNKGGLWNAGADEKYASGSRGLRVEQTGGSYQRVTSPYVSQDRVPLHDYPQQTPPVHSTAQFPEHTGYGQQNTAYGQQQTGYGQQHTGYGQQSTSYGQQSRYEPYSYR